jgi:serine/threonine-protein kinase
MLTGKLPFPGESMQETMIMRLTDDPHPLSAMKPDVSWPADLQAVMDKVLARRADERYRNASEYAHDLVQAIDRMPVTSITSMGTEVLKRVSQGSANAAAAAATAATVQVNVPKTRVATKDDAAPIARPAAPSPAATPTKSKTPMYAGIGLLVAAGIAGAMFLKPGGSKPSPDSANSAVPPSASNPTDTSKQVASSGTPAQTPVNQLNQTLPSRTSDSLVVLENEVKAVDVTDTSTARGILNRAVRLDARENIDKIRRALVIYDADLVLDKEPAGCLELLGVKELVAKTKGAPEKASQLIKQCDK